MQKLDTNLLKQEQEQTNQLKQQQED